MEISCSYVLLWWTLVSCCDFCPDHCFKGFYITLLPFQIVPTDHPLLSKAKRNLIMLQSYWNSNSFWTYWTLYCLMRKYAKLFPRQNEWLLFWPELEGSVSSAASCSAGLLLEAEHVNRRSPIQEDTQRIQTGAHRKHKVMWGLFFSGFIGRSLCDLQGYWRRVTCWAGRCVSSHVLWAFPDLPPLLEMN